MNLTSYLPAAIAATFDADMNAFVLCGEDFKTTSVKLSFPEVGEDGEITVRFGLSFPTVGGQLVQLGAPDGKKIDWVNLLSRKCDLIELLEAGFLSQADAEAVLAWAEENAVDEGENSSAVLTLRPLAEGAVFFNLRKVMKPQADGSVAPAANPVGIDNFCLECFALNKQKTGGFKADWSEKNVKLSLR